MIDHVLAYTLPAAYALLPQGMRSQEATALLLAIGLQESRFTHRRQVNGPARSFWQFEIGGLRGVLHHQASRPALLEVLASLRYPPDRDPALTFVAIEHNDTLAACCARCLLWTLPGPLPGPGEPAEGWRQYLEAWRPGRPVHETWYGHYTMAWSAVRRGRSEPPTLKV